MAYRPENTLVSMHDCVTIAAPIMLNLCLLIVPPRCVGGQRIEVTSPETGNGCESTSWPTDQSLNHSQTQNINTDEKLKLTRPGVLSNIQS